MRISGVDLGCRSDIWVEFYEVVDRPGPAGVGPDAAGLGDEFPVGASLIVGDDEGNTVRATVVGRQPNGVYDVITLHLHMATFRPAHTAGDW